LKEIEGGKPTAAKSHGSSDCNYLGAHPIMIDGLGPRGSGLHTLEERIELPSLETRAEAVAQFLRRLENEKF
jgi:glutamate carboxypeptidase